jgi:hypothetical protein
LADVAYSVAGNQMRVHVGDIRGTIPNPFGAIKRLCELAREEGATSIVLSGKTLINNRLIEILIGRYGGRIVSRKHGMVVIEIPVP